MKILLYIFSFFILIMSVMPCCAMEQCQEEITRPHDRQENDDACNNCSPFFNCEGCATATVNTQFPQFDVFTISARPLYNLCIVDVLPGIRENYWQPPKIG